MDAQEYINSIRQAILANSYAHAFYFPPNKQERHDQSLRLAREIGVGLAGLDGGVDIIQNLYSSLIVRLSFDNTGVCIDAKEFFDEVRNAMHSEEHRSNLRRLPVVPSVDSPHPEYHQESLWGTPHTQTQDHQAAQVSP